MRTSLQKKVGGYDPRLPHLADTQLWMRLASHADVGYLRGVDQAFYRKHDRNMSMDYDQVQELRQGRLAFDSVLEDLGGEWPDETELARTVHRKLAWEALFMAARAYDQGCAVDYSVDDLIAFAEDCWPNIRRLPIYHTLQLRRRLGPRTMSRLGRFMPSERGVRFLAESRDRYDSPWEAVEALVRPGRQSVRFA